VSSLKFNKIVFFESLNSNELKTGKSLAEDLEYINIKNTIKIPIEFYDIPNVSTFIKHLEKITKEAEKKTVFPIIQIDAHGSNNPPGLVMKSGELIEWIDLEENLRKLNIASKGNLLLVTASCFGQFANTSVAIANRAPFWAVVGPMASIQVNDIMRSLRRFYSSLLSQSSPYDIAESLNNSSLKVVTAEWFFVQSYRYLVEKLDPSLPASKSEFENLLNQYFMLDIYPENTDKISITYEQLGF
jgi:hypothetical protein